MSDTTERLVCAKCGLDETHVLISGYLLLEKNTVAHGSSQADGCTVAKLYSERDMWQRRARLWKRIATHFRKQRKGFRNIILNMIAVNGEERAADRLEIAKAKHRARLWKRAVKEYRKARNGNRLLITRLTDGYEEQAAIKYLEVVMLKQEKEALQTALDFERTQSAGLAAHHAHETAALRQEIERLKRMVEDVQNNNAYWRDEVQKLQTQQIVETGE